jgi:hypothetical protein
VHNSPHRRDSYGNTGNIDMLPSITELLTQ